MHCSCRISWPVEKFRFHILTKLISLCPSQHSHSYTPDCNLHVKIGAESMKDSMRHNFEDTDGDNNPFHVTNCLTTCADGLTPIPPFLGHSNPSATNDDCNITSKYLHGIVSMANGKRINSTGIRVFVTKSGSMTKKRFPNFCKHFVRYLPQGQGKEGLPVILVFDGHASRWSYQGLHYLLQHNVYCLCLPGHTSIWAQPNDCGPNSSFKSILGDHICEWRNTHRTLPGSESLVKMERGDFNSIFCQAWLAKVE